MEPGQEDLVNFMKENQGRTRGEGRGVVAVLRTRTYGEDNVGAERGRGLFQWSVAALLESNEAR